MKTYLDVTLPQVLSVAALVRLQLYKQSLLQIAGSRLDGLSQSGGRLLREPQDELILQLHWRSLNHLLRHPEGGLVTRLPAFAVLLATHCY